MKREREEIYYLFFFFFKQKTAYEIRPCDWSSDVCSSDLGSDGCAVERGSGDARFERQGGARVQDRRSERAALAAGAADGAAHHRTCVQGASDRAAAGR